MKLLPVEIFSIIQEYIGNEKEYIMFMNCNKEIFQSIKYQTVFFMIRINSESDENILGQFKNVQNLISRVKDKSKQIGLYSYHATFQLLMLYAQVFHQINHLKVSFFKIVNEVNFSTFNSIYHVELYDLQDITTINSGFENVRILSITNAYNLTTIDLSHVQLFEFSLMNCPHVSVLKGINSIRCLTLHNIPASPDGFRLQPNIPYKSISINLYSPYLDMLCQCNLSHLTSLSLYDLDVDPRLDLSIFMNIPDLTIMTSDPNHYLLLPRFNGRSLELSGFNLDSWTSAESIPNVKRIKLMECTNLDPQLSFLTNVRNISLYKIDSIKTLISLSNCIQLELNSMKSLQVIANQPRLSALKLSGCSKLLDYEMDGQFLNQVQIDGCPDFQYLHKFRNTREFIFYPSWSTNYTFLGYDSSDLPSFDRIVRMTIQTYPVFINYSDLANLHLFSIMIRGECDELTHFHDIHTVEISNSFGKIKEISHLRNIQVLQFTQIKHLTSLHHLENIDKIMLCAFPADFQFDGLKGCRVVYSRGNKRLEEQAELYGRGVRDVSLFDSNYLEMFGSIEEFYVVLEKPERFNWQKLQEYDISRLW